MGGEASGVRMKAIDFVVRDPAGAVQRGVVGAEDALTTVALTGGLEISFNLRQGDLLGQRREGDALILTLIDGREVRLENYFDDAGAANRLFISADGYLNEVALIEGSDGAVYAQYTLAEEWGKWSPSDELIYLGGTEVANLAGDEEVSMLAPALLGGLGSLGAGAAAAGGLALVGGLIGDGDGGGSGGGTGRVAPSVDDPATVSDVGGDDAGDHVLEVTGTGEPGEAVTVTVGPSVVETVIDPDGTWVAVFEDETFPADGTYETVVVVTGPDGDETLDGPGFVIDTTPPAIAVTSGTGSVGDLHNATDFAEGVTLTGTGEAGALAEITIDGVTRTTTIAQDGTWSATWEAGVLEAGEYTTDVVIVARDAFGNSTTLADTVVIDTITDLSIDSGVEGDDIINADEASDGVTFTGQAQPGSTVEITFAGVTTTVIATAGGTWAASFAAGDIPTGEQELTLTAVATDAAGNSSSASSIVNVDTLVNALSYTSTSGGADGVLNAAEAASGMVVTGKVEPGSTVMVTLEGTTKAADVAADGSWSVTFAPGEVPGGTYTTTMTAVATDAAGNTRSATQEVTVDTDASVLTINSPVEGDDLVNGAEASDGVMLTGTADPGALISVTMAGITTEVVTGADGAWNAFFAAGDVAQGTYMAEITATTTDAAGNTATASHSVEVDTRVDNLSISNPIAGDDVVSGAEQSAGIDITGTTEVGSTVMVTLGDVRVPAQVDAAGNWTATFSAGQIPAGEYETTVVVEATDRAGNTATVSDTVAVDTLVSQLTQSDDAGADRTLSGAEAQDGMALSGQVEPGSTVAVDFNGMQYAAIVDASGNWTLDIPPGDIALGEYDATITVMATDAVGNTETISDVVRIDTEAPDGPVVASFTRDVDGFRGISAEQSDGDLSVAAVKDGAISDVDGVQVDIDVLDETNITFTTDVPDGSDLIVSATDGVGNTSSTYLALDDESADSTVDLGVAGLGNLQIEAVDLQFAEEADLTITEAQLVALSSSNTLTVHGGADDTVTLTGATRSSSTEVDGQSYDVYTMGAGTIIIDDDIQIGGVV